MVGVKGCERPYLLPLVCIFHMVFVCIYIYVYQFVCALLLFPQIFECHAIYYFLGPLVLGGLLQLHEGYRHDDSPDN